MLGLSLLTLLSACAESPMGDSSISDDSHSAIIGGIDAKPTSKLENQVLLLTIKTFGEVQYINFTPYTPVYESVCSSVALTHDILLTAGHCWDDTPGAEHFVKVKDENQQTLEIKVINSIVHKGYKNGVKNYDLALFKLESPLPKNIILSKVPEHREQLTPIYVNAAGFGKTVGNLDRDDGLGELRIVTLKVDNYRTSLSHFTINTSNGKGTCQGDSGGPLFAYKNGQAYVVGVTSRGHGQKQFDLSLSANVCDGRSTYIKTDNNLRWIKSSIQELNKPAKKKTSLLEEIIKATM